MEKRLEVTFKEGALRWRTCERQRKLSKQDERDEHTFWTRSQLQLFFSLKLRVKEGQQHLYCFSQREVPIDWLQKERSRWKEVRIQDATN